ncbi:hypothetical protein [Nesterenkonia pannonica]|nr:hypothetical protein [Nesterenkonia pannonica]
MPPVLWIEEMAAGFDEHPRAAALTG